MLGKLVRFVIGSRNDRLIKKEGRWSRRSMRWLLNTKNYLMVR